LLLLAGVVPALAQVSTGEIFGKATDGTGAVLPGVTVTLSGSALIQPQVATTTESGAYRFPRIPIGTYTVTFELQGFKKLVREKLDLRSNTTQEVDAELQVGELGQSVEVTSETPLLETQTSATGATVEGDFLYKMPLYQRYINSTLNIVPGMTSGGYAYGGDLGAYHLAGQRNGSIGIFEDGVLGNDQQGGQGTIKPVQNAVEEVKVLTTTLPAETTTTLAGSPLTRLSSLTGRNREKTRSHRSNSNPIRASDDERGKIFRCERCGHENAFDGSPASQWRL
jgi:hypothetical protein